MKILITGAAGCLGRRLIQSLNVGNETQVFATDIRPQADIKLDDSNHITYKALDICQPDFYQWVEQIKPDVIVHLASILQISKAMPREKAYEIDVVATRKLVELAAKIDCQKFIITTSGASFGYWPENTGWLSEEHPKKGNPDYFYSAHKAEIEAIMAEAKVRYPALKQVILRPGTILGPDFDGPIVNLFQQKIITGVAGYPGPFVFIWSEDVVAYVKEAMFTGVEGDYNLAGDGSVSMAQIARTLNKPYLPLPAWLIEGALSILKPLGVTQYGPEQVKFVKYRPVLANDKIKKTFSHQPTYTSQQALEQFLALQKDV
ncbi:NAD-dependent epimerase/dehydratase family protein [Thalassotalea mangrovi]|uniref:NAD-dependent epimerase/dehydratase family protein n=1 Tax=Thalassotalea mangrovi TaxID=2572245 RepID=A0A4U1B784_9GAMM|nr:NAD-dependent epimerase/dehydratase family protein [Thalassotalea mangrovi]TKB45736.1 NAD-dependent epimerase/dehydratase family protein [Thalassotalea mangrovi]